MEVWTFIWLMACLKIPIVALFLIVRWAVRQTPEPASGGDGGVGPCPGPRQPHHPRPDLRRPPRRGAHGGSQPPSPPRVRTHVARRRVKHV